VSYEEGVGSAGKYLDVAQFDCDKFVSVVVLGNGLGCI